MTRQGRGRRVVVTGLGLVSCFGSDVDHFYQTLLQGTSGVRPIQAFDASTFATRFAAEVSDLDLTGYVQPKIARRVDPFIQYALVAGKKALEAADLPLDRLAQLDRARCGVLMGSGMGGMQIFSDGVKTLQERGIQKLTPFFVPYIITNMGSGLLAIDTGFTGPSYSISTACATANYCMIAAANHICRGEADLVVCGGSEAPITPIGIAGFIAMKALSQKNEACQAASRPWDKGRDGFVVGEGSGALVLEELEHAKRRGAPILAEYIGGGVSSDAYHITAPDPQGQGVEAAMRAAMCDGQVTSDQIDYINAHATSTPVGDLCEIRAIRRIFQDDAKRIALNATKSLIGHCLGAAAAVEAIVSVKALQTQTVHPNLNLEDREEELELFDPLLTKRSLSIDKVMNNSFGFGGHNSCVILGRFDPNCP